MFIEIDLLDGTNIFLNSEDIAVVLPLVNSTTKKEVGIAVTMRSPKLQVLQTTSYSMTTFGSLLNVIKLTKKAKPHASKQG
jgi:hypothetical protein